MADIIILSWVDFEPGDREIYLAHSDELMAASHSEEGCLRHVMAPDPHSETAVIAHAHYRDSDALDLHVKSEPFAKFLEQTKECRVRERRTDRFEAKQIS